MSFPDFTLMLPHTKLRRWRNNNMRRSYSDSELHSMAQSQLALVQRGMPPLIMPIVATPGPGVDYDQNKPLYIVAGSRRHAGNATLGDKAPRLNCLIRYYPDEHAMLAAMRTENGIRKDPTPLEWAIHFDEALKGGTPLHVLCEESGKSNYQVESLVGILALSPAAQTLIDDGALPLRASPLLAKISDPAKQTKLAKHFAAHRFTLKRMETVINSIVAPKEKMPRHPATNNLPSDLHTGLDDLRAAADTTCRHCDIGLRLTVREPAWHLALKAAGEVCETCDIKSIAVCKGCPLASMLSRVARHSAERVG